MATSEEEKRVSDHLSDLAQRLGRQIAEHSPAGLPTHFGGNVLEAHPDEGRSTRGMAPVELQADRLVTLSHVRGPHLPRVRTAVELSIAGGPAGTGHDTVEASVVLARLLLEKPELGGNAAKLEGAGGRERRPSNPAVARLTGGERAVDTRQSAETLGWEPRRMNSAICYLERVGAIKARHALASGPWRAEQLVRADEPLRLAPSHG